MDGEIERTPMKRMGSVEEIVDCIAFLASPMSSFVCGSTLVVDGYVTYFSCMYLPRVLNAR